MPCYDARDDSSYVRAETEREVRADCRHNSDVAELLCHVMTRLAASPGNRLTVQDFLTGNPALARWWREHQERDRVKAQRAREAAEKKQHNAAIDAQIKALQRKKM